MANKSIKYSPNQYQAITLGTFGLLVYQIIAFGILVSAVGRPLNHEVFSSLFAGNAIAIIVALSLLVVYIKNIINNKKLSDGQKVGWAIAIFVFVVLAMAAYWYKYVYRAATVKSG